MQRYKEYQQLNLPSIGKEILKKWEEDNAFEKSIDLRKDKTPFVFYEGPPSANGMPGIHHVISRTLKDLVCRYKTMRGYQVKRKGGWDTHGLPVELGVEKELGISKEDIGTGKKDINGVEVTVEYYNQKCREAVLRYKDQWDNLTQKMGYWVDLKHPYITFENNYIETLWWCLKELYTKGLLYEDVSIQPYSPAAGTGLSSHELNQPGTYKDVKDTSCVAMFKISEPIDSYKFINKKTLEQIFTLALKASNIHVLTLSKEIIDSTGVEIFFLAWTTTPWTLPSNLGLTVGPRIDYVLVKTFNPYSALPVNVILAKALINKYFKSEDENGNFDEYVAGSKILPWKILGEFKGSDLEHIRYEQLLPFNSNSPEKIQELTPNADPFRVITGDFVTTEDGTGIVHTAPAFGADDFKAGKKNNLGILTLVDKEGKFIDGVGEFSGRYVKNYKDEIDYKDVNVDISVKLKKKNRAFKIEKYEHNYPHCWRTDKPVIYYPLDAWFIKTTALKERMIELNNTINWKPASTGTGRFGNWLENMVDWNLSRSRFWGTPLPIWRNGIYNLEVCLGSLDELREIGFLFDKKNFRRDVISGDLKERFDSFFKNPPNLKSPHFRENDFSIIQYIIQNPHFDLYSLVSVGVDASVIKEYLIPIEKNTEVDLHKPFIDEIFIVINDKLLTRVPDLIDVWFDSGAMPYAQWHYPFENIEIFKQNFPADFIAEGVDQTRGWFYTLHVLGVLLFDSVAYKTVISNGLVLDKNGEKMSKRLGNVVDPFHTLEKFGPDATRWYLITNASPWDSLRFDIEGIKEVQRKFFGTLYNTYQFFALYANIDGFIFSEELTPVEERPEIDRWILSELNTLIKTVQQSLDDYEPTEAGRNIEKFVDEQLSNWYVRLCRRRFWKGEYEHDKISAYQTLYECLETLSKLIAPVAPFFADWLFNNLNNITNRIPAKSVHHTDFPSVNFNIIDVKLERRMQLAQDISSLILSLRKKVNIKVRQPLQKALIPALDAEIAENIKLVEDIIKSETNVKEIEILSGGNNFLRKKAKANYKALGKKLGARMKWAAGEIQKFNDAEIEAVQKGSFILNKDFKQQNEEPVVIAVEDIEVTTDEIPGFEVASKGLITVALDITINKELKMEGEAREFVNRIQNIRKDSNLEVTDKIFVKVSENESLKASFTQFNAYICAEILAEKIEFVPEILNGTSIDVNEITLKVNVIKKGHHNGKKN